MNRSEALILSVFNKAYGTEFDSSAVGEKMRMHKLIYLLQELEVVCGDYDFFWHVNGPFSHELHKTLLHIEDEYTSEDIHKNSNSFIFDGKSQKVIETLKDVFAKSTMYDYSVHDWCELLGSLHYLKKYKCRYKNDDEIVQTLEVEKKHLNNHKSNCEALNILYNLGCF